MIKHLQGQFWAVLQFNESQFTVKLRKIWQLFLCLMAEE